MIKITSPNHTKRNLLSITPNNEEIINSRSKEKAIRGTKKNAVTVTFKFSKTTDLLEELTIDTAPIELNLSKEDVKDKMTSFAFIGSLLALEKKDLPHVLKDEIFNPDHVLKIFHDLKKMKV